MEVWKEIQTFPGYSVSNLGEIRRDRTGRILKQNANQYGVMCVGMMRGSRQHHRSVALLVATEFMPRPNDIFDTPINLDGDRSNNAVDNLVWRPRWFAIMYNRQFKEPYGNPITNKIEDIKTGEVYENSTDCAIKCGLLEREVVLCILNRTYVWPTYQEFRVIEE